jgi:PEP-CTERM/exosortase A-associated glycosyltransferase
MNHSRSLRILHILDHSLPLHSGYSFRSNSIFQEQIRRGWMPIALTSLKHAAESPAPHADVEVIDGIRYYRSPVPKKNMPAPLDQLQVVARTARRLYEVIRVEQPDVLHAHSPILNAMAALHVGRRVGIPVVYEIRAFWEDAAVNHGTYSQDSWRYAAVRRMETYCCRRAKAVAVLCEGIRGDLIGRGIPSSQLTVIPNGIDADRFGENNGLPAPEWRLEGKLAIGFIGSFYRYEGLDLLIRAFDGVRRSFKPQGGVLLVLAGGGIVETELREQVRQLGIASCVRFLGRVPHSRIASLYASLDLLVYPRRSMRLTELVTPLKPLESMAMGRPIIASDVGGHKELITDSATGLLFKADDAADLQTRMESFIRNPERALQISEQARRWVLDNRTWQKTTAGYDVIYAQAMRMP